MKINLSKEKIIGMTAVFGAALMWAIEPILTRFASESYHIIQISSTRAFFCVIIAYTYILLTDKGRIRIRKDQLHSIFWVSLTGTVSADLIYYYALTRIPALNAVIIGHLQPVFIVLLGFIFLKEDRLHIYDYFGILFMISAAFLVVGKNPEKILHLQIGTVEELWVVFATFLWAVAGIIMRKNIQGLNAGLITFYRFLTAFIFFGIYQTVTGLWKIPGPFQILLGLTIGFGYTLYYEGLKRLKAAQVASFELAAPIFAAILGFTFFQEKVSWMQIIGIMLLFPGVYLLSKHEDEQKSKIDEVIDTEIQTE